MTLDKLLSLSCLLVEMFLLILPSKITLLLKFIQNTFVINFFPNICAELNTKSIVLTRCNER